ncbi:MAG: sugar ABC transporter ATP-binding protein [Aeromicrobium sp.]
MVQVVGLSKAFNGVPALSGVDFDLRPGEVHGLLGANGCGKSTLIKVLAGFHQADAGQILVCGEEVSLPLGPRGLRDHGMAFVHQDLGLVPNSTVLEHMALDTYGRFGGLTTVSWRKERARVEELLSRFEVSVDLDATVDTLSPVQRAMVAIVRAVGGQQAADSGSERAGRVLVLDEPTVFLPRDEVEILLGLLHRLKQQGDAVLLVSHDLDEVLLATDRLTVLRDGRLVGTRATEGTTRQDVVEMILGAHDEHVARQAAVVRDDLPPLLSAVSITGDRIKDLSLDLRAGEVVGFTGLAGSGFEELPELLFGARKLHTGSIAVGGVTVKRPSPGELMAHGVVLIPSDRKKEGAAQELTVTENLAIPFLKDYAGGWRLRWSQLREQALAICTRLNVTPLNPSLNFGNLSGGNQQKALLGKWLQTNPSIMLLNEPTQGVDVGARKEIFRLIRSAVTDGMAVLCCTSDYEQLVEMADRVVVLHDGRVHKQLYGADITKAQLAASIYSEEAVS